MLAFLRKHGIAVFADDPKFAGSGIPYLLPNPHYDDADVPDKVPILLNSNSLNDFGRGGSIAVTSFGPPSLASDKIQNEDFALAGVLDGRDGPLSFGIVADGVTSKTFWPARASRIAAFAAYETLKKLAAAGWQPAEGDTSGVDQLLHDLCGTLERRFRDDRDILIKLQAAPANWDRSLYQHYGERLAWWYQTTLLVTVMGSRGGWLVFCGDGGVVRFLVDAEGLISDAKVALESPETVELPGAVSIGVTALHFKRVFIRSAPPQHSVQVVLASDGIDRSLKNRRNGGALVNYATLDLGSQKSAQDTIDAIAGWPEADRDNMSLVRACFPPGAAWRTTPMNSVVPTADIAGSPSWWKKGGGGRLLGPALSVIRQPQRWPGQRTAAAITFTLGILAGATLALALVAGDIRGTLLSSIQAWRSGLSTPQSTQDIVPQTMNESLLKTPEDIEPATDQTAAGNKSVPNNKVAPSAVEPPRTGGPASSTKQATPTPALSPATEKASDARASDPVNGASTPGTDRMPALESHRDYRGEDP